MACLGLVTTGPFLEPLCSLPDLNSSITTLFYLYGVSLGHPFYHVFYHDA
jgi:hypothetical protein